MVVLKNNWLTEMETTSRKEKGNTGNKWQDIWVLWTLKILKYTDDKKALIYKIARKTLNAAIIFLTSNKALTTTKNYSCHLEAEITIYSQNKQFYLWTFLYFWMTLFMDISDFLKNPVTQCYKVWWYTKE